MSGHLPEHLVDEYLLDALLHELGPGVTKKRAKSPTLNNVQLPREISVLHLPVLDPTSTKNDELYLKKMMQSLYQLQLNRR